MNCKKAESLLVEYLYEELSAQKTVELERHLQSCDQCSATLESWKAIHHGYQKMEDAPAPSPFLKQRIVAAAEEELAHKPSFGLRLFAILRPAIVVPIVLVALLALWPLRMAKKTEMAETKPVAAPSIALKNKVEAKAPARPESNATATSDQPKLSRKDEEAPQSLGYLSDGKKEADKLSQKDDRQLTRRKAFEDRDQEKQVAQSELQSGGAPAEAVPAPAQNASAAPTASAPAAAMDQTAEEFAKKAKPQSVNMKEDAAKNNNYEISQTMFQQNKLSTGRAVAQEAINEDQKQELAGKYYQSGINYQSQNQFQTAIVQYELVLKNYPAYTQMNDILQRLADSYAALGQFEDAKKVYERMLKNTPNDQGVRQKLEDLDQRQKAREQLRSLGYVSNDKQ